MVWINSDGLAVRFGKEQGKLVAGGDIVTDERHKVVFDIDWTDVLSATPSILGSVGQPGVLGVEIPKNVRILSIEIQAKNAFTSSGTIGTSTLLIGLIKKSDLVTELDFDGFTTASFVGSRLDAINVRTLVEVGATGVGAFISGGATLSAAGYVCVSNSQHGSHPFTAGKASVKIEYYVPANV